MTTNLDRLNTFIIRNFDDQDNFSSRLKDAIKKVNQLNIDIPREYGLCDLHLLPETATFHFDGKDVKCCLDCWRNFYKKTADSI